MLEDCPGYRHKAFILENVPSILSGESEDLLRDALNTLRDYQCKAVHVNSLQFGLPQNRKRVYVIGLRHGAVFGDERSAISDIIADLRAVRAREPSWPDYFKVKGLLETWGHRGRRRPCRPRRVRRVA